MCQTWRTAKSLFLKILFMQISPPFTLENRCALDKEYHLENQKAPVLRVLTLYSINLAHFSMTKTASATSKSRSKPYCHFPDVTTACGKATPSPKKFTSWRFKTKKMVRECAAAQCSNYGDSGKSFHSFPLGNKPSRAMSSVTSLIPPWRASSV